MQRAHDTSPVQLLVILVGDGCWSCRWPKRRPGRLPRCPSCSMLVSGARDASYCLLTFAARPPPRFPLQLSSRNAPGSNGRTPYLRPIWALARRYSRYQSEQQHRQSYKWYQRSRSIAVSIRNVPVHGRTGRQDVGYEDGRPVLLSRSLVATGHRTSRCRHHSPPVPEQENMRAGKRVGWLSGLASDLHHRTHLAGTFVVVVFAGYITGLRACNR